VVLPHVDERGFSLDRWQVIALDDDLDALVPLRLAHALETIHASDVVRVHLVQLADDLVPRARRPDETRNLSLAEQDKQVSIAGAVLAADARPRVDVLVGEAPFERAVDEEPGHGFHLQDG
jgi:hypothetical protein